MKTQKPGFLKRHIRKQPESTIPHRTVDTAAYITVLRDLVESGNSVSLLIAGMSMFPFLVHNRDTVYFEAPKRPLKKGDIVFYQRKNGEFVLHRICAVKEDGYYLIGDAQRGIEGPIAQDQIFAVVTRVIRNGKELDHSSFVWKFFEKFWINVIPARRVLMLPWRVKRKLRKIMH